MNGYCPDKGRYSYNCHLVFYNTKGKQKNIIVTSPDGLVVLKPIIQQKIEKAKKPLII